MPVVWNRLTKGAMTFGSGTATSDTRQAPELEEGHSVGIHNPYQGGDVHTGNIAVEFTERENTTLLNPNPRVFATVKYRGRTYRGHGNSRENALMNLVEHLLEAIETVDEFTEQYSRKLGREVM